MKAARQMTILDGLGTGMVLQLAVGPVFFFVAGITLDSGLWQGLAAVLGVGLADYVYITLAILGVGRVLGTPRRKKILGIGGALVLAGFGIFMLVSGLSRLGTFLEAGSAAAKTTWTLGASFASAFALTISSPLTIVFWTGMFATKATEKAYSRRELVVFGVAAGAATIVFLGFATVALSLVGTAVPRVVLPVLNTAVGALLTAYGIFRLIASLGKDTR